NRQESSFLNEVSALPEQLHLCLAELTAPTTAVLVEERLQGRAEQLVTELVFAQTQGNPFFAEEMIDALRDRGQLTLQDGVWRAGRTLVQALHETNSLERVDDRWQLRINARLDAVTLGIPDTVHGLVLSRLDRLAEETRLTLKVASVIGRVFEIAVLAEAHPRSPDEDALRQQIEELESRDFARMEAPPPHPVYIFKHSITQEAIYQTLLESQRQVLHLAVGSALEHHAPSSIEQLAHHFMQADLTQPAVCVCALRYLDAAAWRAKRSYANETALAYFDRALSIETRWQWLAGKVGVLHILGQRLHEEATLAVLETEPEADRAIVAALWADYYEATSQFPEARANLEEAFAVYEARADWNGQAHMLSRIGEIALREGDIDEAEQHYRRALMLLPKPADDANVRAQVMLGLGIVMRQRGEYDDAFATLTQALDLYESQDDQPQVATALTRLGGVAFLRRDFGAALDLWQRALHIRRTIGDREAEGSSLLNIAQAYTSLGDYGAALPMLRHALDIQRSVGNRWWENAVWNALGIIALTVGDYVEAQRCISVAARLCISVGDEAGAAIMEFNLGQVERECGDYSAALNRLTRSRQWAHENADLEFEAQCLTESALTAQVAGMLDEAEQFANAALRLYETLEGKATMTTDLATLALVCLARQEIERACALTEVLLEIFDQSESHQIEYPQRDLYVASLVEAACGRQQSADFLLRRAHDLVLACAANISDEALRRSYLENVRVNRDVCQARKRSETV
ncbi:MAG: tetratricopeptide repeat protein, partial [Caldilinea sp.]